jgi:hypothetical protein
VYWGGREISFLRGMSQGRIMGVSYGVLGFYFVGFWGLPHRGMGLASLFAQSTDLLFCFSCFFCLFWRGGDIRLVCFGGARHMPRRRIGFLGFRVGLICLDGSPTIGFFWWAFVRQKIGHDMFFLISLLWGRGFLGSEEAKKPFNLVLTSLAEFRSALIGLLRLPGYPVVWCIYFSFCFSFSFFF